MKKLLLSIALLATSVMAAQAQLLYRISGNGLEKPSYIIGTYHLANIRFAEKIDSVKYALTKTDQVYGELNWDDVKNVDSIKMVTQASLLPKGKTLKTVLSPAQFAKVDKFMQKVMGVGLSNPKVFAQMGSQTPATLTTNLVSMMFMVGHMGEFDPTNPFDSYFPAQARKNNEKIGGLETLKFQADVLFKSTPMKRQIQQLMCLIDNEDFNNAVLSESLDAFYAQDLVALKKVIDKKLHNSCDDTPEEFARMFTNRNKAWIAKMPAIMKDKPTFFAVGAGHLVGEQGVLQLLRKAGYTVTGMK